MKVKEITEWRLSPFDPASSGITIDDKLPDSSFVTNINLGSLPGDSEDVDHGSLDLIRYDYANDSRLYMLVWSAKTWQPPVLARLWLQQVTSNVWQIKEIIGTPNFPVKDLGMLLVKNVLIVEHLRIINDFDMSDSAENLWMNKLSTRIKGIYDKEKNQVYPLSAVGTFTGDGTEIIHPRNDQGNPDDWTGESQRFFIILENSHRAAAIAEAVQHKQEWRRKTLLEASVTDQENKWQRADVVKRIFDR